MNALLRLGLASALSAAAPACADPLCEKLNILADAAREGTPYGSIHDLFRLDGGQICLRVQKHENETSSRMMCAISDMPVRIKPNDPDFDARFGAQTAFVDTDAVAFKQRVDSCFVPPWSVTEEGLPGGRRTIWAAPDGILFELRLDTSTTGQMRMRGAVLFVSDGR